METQVPEQPPTRKPRILFVLVGIIVAALFIALNVWVYRLATKKGASSAVPSSAVPSSAGLKKPSVPPNVPQGTQIPSGDSVGSQPTPLPPPPIPPDPVPPVNVGPSFVGTTTLPTPTPKSR